MDRKHIFAAYAKKIIVEYTVWVVKLSQNAFLKKILKILQAVKTSGLTNLHTGYLTTPKGLDSHKKQIW